MRKSNGRVRLPFIMKTVIISPINVEERNKLEFKAGDTVRVWQKIQEKDKTRLQAFEGLVLARKHGKGASASFTVRKVMDGVGVEKIYPLYSPMIDKIEITRRAKVRRSKLYFVREKAAKEIKRQMRRVMTMKDEDLVTPEEAPVVAEKAEKTEEVK